jgi:hypothetical protein
LACNDTGAPSTTNSIGKTISKLHLPQLAWLC